MKKWEIIYREVVGKDGPKAPKAKEVEADDWYLDSVGITFRTIIDNKQVNVFWVALSDVRTVELKS